MKTHFFLLLTPLLFLGKPLLAQDEFFSQYYTNRFFTNPVFAGDNGNVTRISSQYKQQWTSVGKPYVTTAIGIDKGWQINNGKQVSAGLIVLNDRAGTSRFTSNLVAGALCYGFALNAKSSVSAALQVGMWQRGISYEGMRFDRQYTGRFVDESLSTGENFTANNFTQLSASAGVMYSQKINRRNNFSLAMGFMQLNSPSFSFVANESIKMYPRITLQGFGEFNPDGTAYTWLPSLQVMMQGPSLMITGGTLISVRKGMDSKYTAYYTSSNVYFGLHIRWGDALIPSFHYEYKKQLMCGISYDINLSRLSNASMARGGFELSASYKIRKKTRIQRLVD